MKQERLIYLDYIRAFSTILIILTHYNALFLYLPEKYTGNGIILTSYVNKLYIGDWGVSLFLILSGAALMYTYKNHFDIIYFFKKRVLSIFPIYWLSYAVIATYFFLRYKTINPSGAESWKIILSFFGMDAYLGTITKTWLCIGEWFLGMIIIIYMIFPLLLWMMNKCEGLLWIIIMVMFVYFITNNPTPMQLSTIVFVRLPEFCFGMAFIKHREKIMCIWTMVGAMLIMMLDLMFRDYIPVSLRTMYLGIVLFIGFVYISKYFTRIKMVNKICAWICKYSYVIFLIHHRIIWEITAKWDMANVTRTQSYILFFICLEITFLCAYLIKMLYNGISNFLIANNGNV